ncbi:DNA repair exonuclease [Candidatus Woesearchaeota archaeon]|nr:DNA repair exonuclease [Candidatus Woesearchaeota archaeon]
MKFTHLADCHIGGWKEEKLKELGIESFRYAITKSIEENVGFVLVAGDLFNTSLPDINIIKETSEILANLKEKDIDCYIIPGSHDFSPSGKTMLDVLEKAGLVKNVFKFENNKLTFTTDKTNTKITGILGLRSGLEKEKFKALPKDHLENEQGFKIFMFHTILEEYKPKDMEKVEGESIRNFPKNFNYYAGGHVHYLLEKEFGKGKVVYPGPLFPNNFKELEELKHGKFCIVDDALNVRRENVKLKETLSHYINANEKTPEQVEQEILEKIKDYKDKIILLRVEGILKSGKPSDINFKRIYESLEDSYCILRNTNKLTSKEFSEIKIESGDIEQVEQRIIEESIKDFKEFGNSELINLLIHSLDLEKGEGEKNIDFEKRVIESGRKALEE